MRDVASWDQQFGDRHRIIWDEVDFQVILGVGVRVDNSSGIDDESDHQLGDVVSRSGFSSKEHNSRVRLLPLFRGHRFESEVSLHHRVSAVSPR